MGSRSSQRRIFTSLRSQFFRSLRALCPGCADFDLFASLVWLEIFRFGLAVSLAPTPVVYLSNVEGHDVSVSGLVDQVLNGLGAEQVAQLFSGRLHQWPQWAESRVGAGTGL